MLVRTVYRPPTGHQPRHTHQWAGHHALFDYDYFTYLWLEIGINEMSLMSDYVITTGVWLLIAVRAAKKQHRVRAGVLALGSWSSVFKAANPSGDETLDNLCACCALSFNTKLRACRWTEHEWNDTVCNLNWMFALFYKKPVTSVYNIQYWNWKKLPCLHARIARRSALK